MAGVTINIADIKQYLGQEIGTSRWMEISQSRVNKFAEATGDFQWVHVDTEQARAELPTGQTVVHNFLLVSLIPQFFDQTVTFTGLCYGQNKGAEMIRFINPLPTGCRVRTRLRLSGLEDHGQGTQTARFYMVMEREDSGDVVLKMKLILLFVAAQDSGRLATLTDEHQPAALRL